MAEVTQGRLTAVSGDPSHPVNRGATCRKPLGLPDAVHAEDRARHPLWRDSPDARFERVSWRQAIGRLARRMQRVIDEHGPDAIAFYISGQLLTEDYYVAGKLVKGFLGTNNLDSNSRLCMSSAVAGYVGALGSDGPPASYADIDLTDCLLLAGTNTAACHPIVWARIAARRRAGASVIVIDPRRTTTAEAADIHLPVRPGTDLPLLSAMLGVLADEGLIDRLFVERHTDGYEETLAAAREWPVARAAEVCGIAAEDIVAAARLFGRAPRAMALWSMGINQSRVGTLKNRALINLCLATGNVGRPGSGPLSLTGQPNAMGGRESGGLSTLLPGYRSVSDPDASRGDAEAVEPSCRSARDLAGPRAPRDRARRGARGRHRQAALDRRHQSGRLAARRPPVHRGPAARRTARLPGRLPPDRDLGAGPRRSARCAVAGEGRDDDELRATRRAPAPRAGPARRGAARLGDIRAAGPRVGSRRSVRVALGGGGLR